MSAIEAERQPALQRVVADKELAEDLADMLDVESRRGQPTEPFRDVLRDLKIRV